MSDYSIAPLVELAQPQRSRLGGLVQRLAELHDHLHTQTVDALQRHFDPNLQRLGAELYNMRNPLGWDGTPQIGSDTNGQSMLQLMRDDPRWGELVVRGARRDADLSHEVQRPMTYDGMNAMMLQLLHDRAQTSHDVMMRGGGL